MDERRRAAWQSLSELFLDTDLKAPQIASIAERLRDTGYSVAQLERMYEEEVAPVCWHNLQAIPGGHWIGFDTDWLVSTIDRHRKASSPLNRLPGWHRWRISRWTRHSRDEWERVKRRLMDGGVT